VSAFTSTFLEKRLAKKNDFTLILLNYQKAQGKAFYSPVSYFTSRNKWLTWCSGSIRACGALGSGPSPGVGPIYFTKGEMKWN